MKIDDLKIEGLFESPELIRSTEFGFDTIGKNRTTLHNLLKKRKEVIIDEKPKYEVFKTGDDNTGEIVLNNIEDDIMEYFVQYEVKKIGKMGTFVTQVKLWRQIGGLYSKGMTQKIFFEYLLNKYIAIMSDELQTARGKEFWYNQLGVSLGKGYHIALANTNTNNIVWYDKTKDGTMHEWYEKMEKIAYNSDKHYPLQRAPFQAKRFVISHKKFE